MMNCVEWRSCKMSLKYIKKGWCSVSLNEDIRVNNCILPQVNTPFKLTVVEKAGFPIKRNTYIYIDLASKKA